MPSDGSQAERREGQRGSSAHRTPLEDVLDTYLEELAEGKNPDQQQYLDRYPELAGALRGVFRTLDFIEATGKSLHASRLEQGQTLGEYRIVREVGRGGMGVVYEAVQTSLNRRVALKILPASAALTDSSRERFLREAETAGRLHHTHIVPVHAVAEEQGILFYVMQFIEGRSLAEHLKDVRQATAPPGREYYRRVARWAQHVAEALAYAHSQGTIHRDIKPSNLLLDNRGEVWVTDFGLAKADAHTTITMTGDVIGTARYMAPEQAGGGRTPLDERTDIYSLGAAVYELLCLEPAFDGDSRDAVLNRILSADPKPARQRNPAIPRPLETIVSKCMEKQPQRRYATAGEVAEDFRRFLVGDPIRAKRTPMVTKSLRLVRRYRVQTLSLAVVAVLAVTILGLLGNMRLSRGKHSLLEAETAILFEHDFTRASRLLTEAESAGIDSAELLLLRGLIPLLSSQPERAIPHIQQALRRDPDYAPATMALALAHNSKGDFVEGRRLLSQFTEGDSLSALGWLLHGLALSKTDRSEAIKSYDQAIALHADFAPAINARAQYRGIRLLTEGNRAELQPMLNDYAALVVFRPNTSASYTGRADGWLFAAAYARTQPDLRPAAEEWLDHCREDLSRAMALRGSDDSLALVRQSTYLRYVGDFRGSATALAEAIAIDRAAWGTSHPYRVHERGMALYARGDLETALQEIGPAAEASPSYCPLPLQHALLLAELGRMETAVAVGRDCLEQQRSNANGLLLSAATLELLGDGDGSAGALRAFASAHAAELASATTVQPGYGPALAYLQREIGDADLLARAGGDPGRRCEYAYLIGLRGLAQGNRDAGLAALQTCIDTGVFVFSEYRFAQAMLARAADNSAWPAWVTQARPRQAAP